MRVEEVLGQVEFFRARNFEARSALRKKRILDDEFVGFDVEIVKHHLVEEKAFLSAIDGASDGQGPRRREVVVEEN